MINFLQTGKALSVFVAIGVIGIVSKLITRSLYKRLVKETDNMAMTKNKNLKILKQKLENAYRLNQNIVNTQAYLDKQIYGFRFMRISLDGWNNLSMQMTIFSLLAGGAASFMSYWYRLDSYYIILYASVGALGSLLLTFLDSSFNITQKQQRLSNALLEYTDNSVFVRAARENTGRDIARDFAATSREIAGKIKNADRSADRAGERTADRLLDRASDRALDKAPDRAMDRTGDRVLERTADRGADRSSDMGGRSLEDLDSEDDRDMVIRENDIRDGIVREENTRRGFPGNLGARSLKAEELLRTVRNMKEDSMSEDEECGGAKGSRRQEREPRQRRNGDRKPVNSDNEARRDIDYLKHSLDQIAVSKEKHHISDDWAKNLDAEEIKVIEEIMRQYFSK